MEIYLKLLDIAVVPVFASVLFFILNEKTPFGKLNHNVREIIIGLFFGFIAILGTELGVDIESAATANVRDAAPLCAGLIFGGPAGIISGIIGGVYRYAVAATAGMYSRVACSVSTAFAGFFAAFLHKFLFENKLPGTVISFVTGVVMEAIHMTVLFLTHLSDAEKAFSVVKICTIPMMVGNGISVFLAVLLVRILETGISRNGRRVKKISEKIHRALLLTVAVAYVLTTFFVYLLQTNTARTEADALLTSGLKSAVIAVNTLDEEQVIPLISETHVGKNGYILVFGKNGKLIIDGSGKYGDCSAAMAAHSEPLTRCESVLNGEKAFWMYQKAGDKTVISVISEKNVYENRDSSVYVNSYNELLVFTALYILVYLLIQGYVVDGVHSLNKSLSKIISGDLETKANVRSSSEFIALSDDINTTVDAMKTLIAKEAARIDEELAFAKKIQFSSIPSAFPAYPDNTEFDIYAKMKTAKEVGGDFYDFYQLGNNRLAFLVADVSGKGIPAAMFMMNARATLKDLAMTGLPLNEVITKANNRLCSENEAAMFVTIWMGILDYSTGEVTFVNGGHNPPLVLKDGKYEYLRTKPGVVLAYFEDYKYKINTIKLEKGDKLFLYTDGVTEATDPDKKLYGEPKLAEHLNRSTALSPEETINSVFDSIKEFAAGSEQADDITVLAVEYKG